ncbi:hypothetical protein chiPu_0027069, partial [Chiloscyllium punctatum]|nr:hypothetical protein [Chiloscyllium punctatum]
KLTNAVRVSVSGLEAVKVGLESGRRQSVSSIGSLLEDRDDDGILSCQHCKGILEQQERRLDERESSPVITQLYTVRHGRPGEVPSTRYGTATPVRFPLHGTARPPR